MNEQTQKKFGISKGLIAILVIVGLLIAGGAMVIGTYTSLRNEGREREIALSATYNSTQIQYGQFRQSFYDQLGVVISKRDAMDKILTDAISGRYDRKGSPGSVDAGIVINAIHEAYPDLAGLNVYDSLVNFVQQGRTKFAGDQAALQERIAEYNKWRTTGSFLHPFLAEKMFPSDSLEARVGDKVYRGREALDRMSRVIVGADTTDIFDSGVDKPLEVPQGK